MRSNFRRLKSFLGLCVIGLCVIPLGAMNSASTPDQSKTASNAQTGTTEASSASSATDTANSTPAIPKATSSKTGKLQASPKGGQLRKQNKSAAKPPKQLRTALGQKPVAKKAPELGLKSSQMPGDLPAKPNPLRADAQPAVKAPVAEKPIVGTAKDANKSFNQAKKQASTEPTKPVSLPLKGATLPDTAQPNSKLVPELTKAPSTSAAIAVAPALPSSPTTTSAKTEQKKAAQKKAVQKKASAKDTTSKTLTANKSEKPTNTQWPPVPARKVKVKTFRPVATKTEAPQSLADKLLARAGSKPSSNENKSSEASPKKLARPPKANGALPEELVKLYEDLNLSTSGLQTASAKQTPPRHKPSTKVTAATSPEKPKERAKTSYAPVAYSKNERRLTETYFTPLSLGSTKSDAANPTATQTQTSVTLQIKGPQLPSEQADEKTKPQARTKLAKLSEPEMPTKLGAPVTIKIVPPKFGNKPVKTTKVTTPDKDKPKRKRVAKTKKPETVSNSAYAPQTNKQAPAPKSPAARTTLAAVKPVPPVSNVAMTTTAPAKPTAPTAATAAKVPTSSKKLKQAFVGKSSPQPRVAEAQSSTFTKTITKSDPIATSSRPGRFQSRELTFNLAKGGKKTILASKLWRIRKSITDFEPKNAYVIYHEGGRFFASDEKGTLILRLKRLATLHQFTMPNGKKVHIAPSQVDVVRDALPGKHHVKAKSLIVTRWGSQQVREPTLAVNKKLRIARAR